MKPERFIDPLARAQAKRVMNKLKGVKGLNMPKKIRVDLLFDLEKLAALVLHDPEFDPNEFMLLAFTALLKNNWEALSELEVVKRYLDRCRRQDAP
jgi:hypothetical protein